MEPQTPHLEQETNIDTYLMKTEGIKAAQQLQQATITTREEAARLVTPMQDSIRILAVLSRQFADSFRFRTAIDECVRLAELYQSFLDRIASRSSIRQLEVEGFLSPDLQNSDTCAGAEVQQDRVRSEAILDALRQQLNDEMDKIQIQFRIKPVDFRF